LHKLKPDRGLRGARKIYAGIDPILQYHLAWSQTVSEYDPISA